MQTRAVQIMCLVGLTLACDPPNRGSSQSAIVNGQPSSSSAVVALVYVGLPTCSGTLVARRLILTAAHCIGSFDGAYFGDDSLEGSGELVPVVSQWTHPLYEPDGYENDVGFALLEADAPAEIQPLAISRSPLPSDFVGSTVRVVGYGQTTADDLGASARREGPADVSEVKTKEFDLQPAPANPCFGDSGGPALADLGRGEEIVGVTSSGDTQCTTFGRQMRVDAYQDFIAPQIEIANSTNQAFGASCFYSDNCASGICVEQGENEYVCTSACEDATDCLPGYECAAAEGGTACYSTDRVLRGGCSSGGPASNGGGLLAIFAFVIVRFRRRCCQLAIFRYQS